MARFCVVHIVHLNNSHPCCQTTKQLVSPSQGLPNHQQGGARLVHPGGHLVPQQLRLLHLLDFQLKFILHSLLQAGAHHLNLPL